MLKVIISGGGSGGHVFPAIAIAQALKSIKPDVELLFVGAKQKMEMEKVPAAGFKIIGLWISGFHRKFDWRNFSFPFKLCHSLWKARKIIRSFHPDLVIGVGGFASGPVLKVASLLNVPTVIQEQNSYPGVTNKLLAKSVDKILTAYEGMEKYFPESKISLLGNPVRQDLQDIGTLRTKGYEHFQLDQTLKTILVFGGSLGARSINTNLASELEQDLPEGVQMIWQVGKGYFEQYKELNNTQEGRLKVLPFIDRMDFAYAVADLVVCRAGALTISELSIVAKPAIFIPSPNVAEDHQTKNAVALKANNAGCLLPDKTSKGKILSTAMELFADDKLREQMIRNIAAMARPNAAKNIAQLALELIKEKR